MSITFITGVPGFIGTRLARRLLADRDARLVCLVFPEPALLEKARAFAAEGNGDGRVEVVPGDIGKPRLGLDRATYERLARETTRVFHLAALYNLAAPRERSYTVNVEGTRHILDFCAAARPSLERLVHISTVVVSGDREGTIYEHELECGQRFRNYYEETKFLSEVEVRRRSGEIPTAVVRPAVVIGDSRSGEIDKYDGPYYFMSALARLERRSAEPSLVARLMAAGNAPALFHIIPVDYLIESIYSVATAPDAIGRTYQVIDPNEMTVGEFRSLILKRFRIPEFPLRVPTAVLKAAARVPGMERVTQMPRQALDYFDLENRYDHANTDAVNARRGVVCPRIPDYIDTLVAFVRSHPEIQPNLIRK